MPEKILLAMSGGVDSSAAALLLLESGAVLSGLTLLLHPGENASNLEDAQHVARQLGFPHEFLSLAEQFQAQVIDRFISEYRAGRTPNPCIDCNREIKFGALLELARRRGFDALATGHYARIVQEPATGRWLLKKAADAQKDQSYVLYQLTQEQLAQVRFPLGGLSKAQARALAEHHGLLNAHRPDSQDICFIPDGDYAAFIQRATGELPSPGRFIDAAGHTLGTHRGLIHYTVGQRKGLGIALGKPAYVLAKDAEDNTVTLGEDSALFSREMLVSHVNLISIDKLTAPMRVQVKARYRHAAQPAIIYPEGDCIRVVFDQPQRAITPGQAAVFYDGDVVVGGGTIL